MTASFCSLEWAAWQNTAKRMKWHNASMKASDCKKFHIYEPEDQPNDCKNSSFLAQSTKVESTSGAKGSTFNSTNTISIFMLLFKLLSTKKGSNLGLEITWYVEIKHLNVKNALCHLPQKPLACISALALSLQLVEDGVIDFSVSGIKRGSIATS